MYSDKRGTDKNPNKLPDINPLHKTAANLDKSPCKLCSYVCIRMCACIHLCICINVAHIHVCIYVCVCAAMYRWVYMYVCMFECLFVCIYMYAWKLHTYIQQKSLQKTLHPIISVNL